jgi:AAA family ATP:ADP antiporter
MMKIGENAIDYSINNTSRQILWLPVSSATKFHGKPAIDTLYVRLGDGLAALTVLIGVHILALPLGLLLSFNLSLVVVWLLIGVLLVREYRRLSAANNQPPNTQSAKHLLDNNKSPLTTD